MWDALSPYLSNLGVSGQPGAFLRMVATALAWLIVATLVIQAMKAGKLISRRTGTEYDDVVLDRMRVPVLMTILFVALLDLVGLWSHEGLVRHMRAALTICLIFSIVWLVQRLAMDVVIHFAQRRAAATATGMDDLLIPIAKSIVRPVTIGIGAMFALEAAGLPIAGAALLIGGASFVLAFALQSTLEDVFGGVGLVVDTPFALGDVVQLENGMLCEVIGLGMRVTRLYNAKDHSVITFSNRALVQQSIVNLSRPTPDMCLSIPVLVAADSDTRLVWERLTEAGLAHPWVLGATALKLPAMRRRMDRLVRVYDYQRAFRSIRDMQRISAEGQLNDTVEHLATHVVEMASRCHVLERGGFDAAEQRLVSDDFDQLEAGVRQVRQRMAIWLLAVRYTYVDGRVGVLSDEDERALDTAVRGALVASDGDSNADLAQVHRIIDEHFAGGFTRAEVYMEQVAGWVQSVIAGAADAPPLCLPGAVPAGEIYFYTQRQEDYFRDAGYGAGLADRSSGGIGDLDEAEEYLALFSEWNKKMLLLQSKMRAIASEWRRAHGMRLDERLHELRLWFGTEFRETTPDWKYPRTPLVQIGQGLRYELRVNVDNVRLSHFTRTAQVESQLRLDILHLLRDQSPSVTFHGTA